MTGFICGVWPARRARSLIAVVVDEDGNARPAWTFGRSPEDAWGARGPRAAMGNVCDADDDNDGFGDTIDLCPLLSHAPNEILADSRFFTSLPVPVH